MNSHWGSPPDFSPAGWRADFDTYRELQATTRAPRINLVEGCGPQYANGTPGDFYVNPTPDDFRSHRLTMGTALLSDGFYGFDLHGNLSVPRWYDEYSVDANGTAVADRASKGYLGQALADAVELSSGGSLVFQENFASGTLPPSFSQFPLGAVSVTNGALVISNPDHTKGAFFSANTNPDIVRLAAGNRYLLTCEFQVLETLDSPLNGFQVDVFADGRSLDRYSGPEVAAGDSGTVHFPFTITGDGRWSIRFAIAGGGGKIAIRNVRLYQDGAGPWRRDFENGFVLVNPFNEPHTFLAAEVGGPLNRTGIRRIKGTQAPDINNGQAVTDSLTLGPFDAIILLAGPIHLAPPTITAVSNSAGGQTGVASGAFVSIYGSNFTPLPYDDWSRSITNGRLPKELDGISVTIGGKPAYIYAVSPGQINLQAPDVGNGPVQVVVTTGGGSSAPFATNSQLYSPAFFPWPGNQPVATHADYSIAAKNGTFSGLTTASARPGEVITLWGTGFGPTNPPVPAGQEPAVQAPTTQDPVTVTLGGTPVPVLGAVLSSYAAVYQIAIQIPASMPDGDYSIIATVNDIPSPAFSLTVQHAP